MVYFISGLGADHRLFKNLDLRGIPHRFLNWVKPLEKESFDHYLNRFIQGIDQKEAVILVGVSFGGIVAQEIACRIAVKKLILISSVKSDAEFGLQLKLVALGKLDNLLPGWAMKRGAGLLANYFFSIETPQDAAFLKELIDSSDPDLIKWSVRRLLEWKFSRPVKNLIHLHGDQDRVFPLSGIKNATVIPGGGHFMVADQAPEISKILRAEILSIPTVSSELKEMR